MLKIKYFSREEKTEISESAQEAQKRQEVPKTGFSSSALARTPLI